MSPLEVRGSVCVHSFRFFFQAEDGIRDAQESRGLGDVYKRQHLNKIMTGEFVSNIREEIKGRIKNLPGFGNRVYNCLLYTSDAADDLLCVDLGGRRLTKKKTNRNLTLLSTQY